MSDEKKPMWNEEWSAEYITELHTKLTQETQARQKLEKRVEMLTRENELLWQAFDDTAGDWAHLVCYQKALALHLAADDLEGKID